MVSAAGPEAEARRQWNPWIRRIAFAAVAVAALGAAAAGGANADAVGEALGLRDEKNVYTTTLFSPGFSVTLPDRWGIAVDSGDAFVPFNPGPQAAFAIYRPWAWADPANEDRAIIPPDIIAWLQANPYLEAGEPTTVTVGGIKGTQIDLASTFAAGDPLGESVKLFFLQSGALGIGLGPQKLHFSIAPGERYRFIVLEDVGKGEFAGDDLVVVAPGFRRAQQGVGPSRLIPLPMTFFDQVVRPVLDTITFERPDPIWGFRKRG